MTPGLTSCCGGVWVLAAFWWPFLSLWLRWFYPLSAITVLFIKNKKYPLVTSVSLKKYSEGMEREASGLIK